MLKSIVLLLLPMVLMSTSIYQSASDTLKHTKKLKVQEIERKIKKKYEDKAKANNYPVIDLNLYNKREEIEFASGASKFQESSNYSLTLKQNLYNGGYDCNEVKFAQQESKIAKIEYDEIEKQLIYESITLHSGLVVAKRLLQFQKELLEHYGSLLHIVNKKANYGDANDKIELQTKIYNAKIKYEQLQSDYEMKKFQYIKLVGKNPHKLKENIAFKTYLIPKPNLVKFDRSNEIVKNLFEIEKAHYKIAQHRATFLPKVDLELKAYKAEPLAQVDYATENQYSAKVNVTYNLYNGGKDKIQDEINKLEKLKLIAKRDEIKQDMYLKYAQYYALYNHAQNNIINLNRYIRNERNKYYRYKKIFQLSSQKNLLDILGALEGLYQAKEIKATNANTQIVNYASLLLMQAKLTLKNIR